MRNVILGIIGIMILACSGVDSPNGIAGPTGGDPVEQVKMDTAALLTPINGVWATSDQKTIVKINYPEWEAMYQDGTSWNVLSGMIKSVDLGIRSSEKIGENPNITNLRAIASKCETWLSDSMKIGEEASIAEQVAFQAVTSECETRLSESPIEGIDLKTYLSEIREDVRITDQTNLRVIASTCETRLSEGTKLSCDLEQMKESKGFTLNPVSHGGLNPDLYPSISILFSHRKSTPDKISSQLCLPRDGCSLVKR